MRARKNEGLANVQLSGQARGHRLVNTVNEGGGGGGCVCDILLRIRERMYHITTVRSSSWFCDNALGGFKIYKV